ncbi:MAG: alanine--tRNA ligase [Sulfurifustaceae bacterium]
MKSNTLRSLFLDYFRRNGHQVVPSSSLVPANDPTLLFTNAGMVQFKDVFLGTDKRPYTRAASSQRCVRAGGKHNDLENVGYTARHHTFFEMLGNFSFGDYFKREAIGFAWEFLTKELRLPPERLWVTVHTGDDEAADIWLKELKVDAQRFARLGDTSNFWAMGDTGPCGPCSEIFYDHGPRVPGGPPGSPDEDGDRYVEIWNLVFMQYNRDGAGKLTALPKPSVDTGMGLERIAAVMQGVHSNYDIDLFQTLIKAASNVIGPRAVQGSTNAASAGRAGAAERKSPSLNVIADHIRASAFLITDGVFPSNEGRGYVLRRVIRRAIRHGHKLGATDTFFYKLVPALVSEMGEAYPELREQRETVERTLKLEEERFNETLEQGLKILDQDIAQLSGDTISGDTIFKLYDTYGFPVDLTRDIALERGLKLDMAGFEREMEAQRARARAASKFEADYSNVISIQGRSEFSGYEREKDQARVTAIYRDLKEPVQAIAENEFAAVVLERTPFYAESGGQVGDTGVLRTMAAAFKVEDTKKHPSGAHLHVGRLERGRLKVGDVVEADVDHARRQKIRLNHSATHLLHAALRQVLGRHVMQKGSLVHPDYLRFDFSHPKPVTPDELQRVEDLVNGQVRANHEAETRVMDLEHAKASGAMALFGEKYEEKVRVLRMSDFSIELCGGTHVRRTGDIGLFKVVSESGVAAGVRRIEAYTGPGAEEWVRSQQEQLDNIARLLKSDRVSVVEKVQQLQTRLKNVEKELEQTKAKLATGGGASSLLDQVKEVKCVHVLAAQMDGADVKILREAVDRFKDKLAPAAIVLASIHEGRVSLIAGVTKDLTTRVNAGELVNHVAAQVGGKGGGRPDMAQAGGNDPAGLERALNAVSDWISARL